MSQEPDLSVQVAGVQCRNPVWVASGCFNYGREYAHLYRLDQLGAICTKGTSLVPWEGNPGVRMAETAGGMLNAIGLQNPGLPHYLEQDAPWLMGEQQATVIVNIVAKTIEEYVRVAEALSPAVCHGVELNISCPNVKEGGLAFGTNLEQAYKVTAAVRQVTRLPLFVKLSPNVTAITDFAKACEAAGADGLTAINTPLGMAIDIRRRQPVIGNLFGGLSGPALKPIALRMVWQVAGAVQIPVVGIGGVSTWEDAVEYLMAGASAVQVGTACFANPLAPLEIIAGLREFMREHGFARVTDLVGAARPRGAAAQGNLPPMGDAPGRPGSAGADLRQWLKDADRA